MSDDLIGKIKRELTLPKIIAGCVIILLSLIIGAILGQAIYDTINPPKVELYIFKGDPIEQDGQYLGKIKLVNKGREDLQDFRVDYRFCDMAEYKTAAGDGSVLLGNGGEVEFLVNGNVDPSCNYAPKISVPFYRDYSTGKDYCFNKTFTPEVCQYCTLFIKVVSIKQDFSQDLNVVYPDYKLPLLMEITCPGNMIIVKNESELPETATKVFLDLSVIDLSTAWRRGDTDINCC